MRTIIDISDRMLNRLDLVREKRKCSRAAITREAIDTFFNQSLGLWKNKVPIKAVFDTCILIDFL